MAGMNVLLAQKVTDYDAARVSVMPSNPHGEISPNDCFYHSDGKEAERASRTDDASNAEITIRTLHYLGEVSADAIRSYWHRNFMVDVDKPSEDMLKGRKTGMWRRRACELELYQCALWSRCHAWGLPPRCEPYCVSLIGSIDSIEGKTILFSLHLLLAHILLSDVHMVSSCC